MPTEYVGNIVQTPMDDGTNGGADKCPAVVLAVGGTGPNGGQLVDAMRFWNDSGATVDHANLEVVEYESDARDTGLGLGVGAGAWPLDYS
jgi:hypothetical protein